VLLLIIIVIPIKAQKDIVYFHPYSLDDYTLTLQKEVIYSSLRREISSIFEY